MGPGSRMDREVSAGAEDSSAQIFGSSTSVSMQSDCSRGIHLSRSANSFAFAWHRLMSSSGGSWTCERTCNDRWEATSSSEKDGKAATGEGPKSSDEMLAKGRSGNCRSGVSEQMYAKNGAWRNSRDEEMAT